MWQGGVEMGRGALARHVLVQRALGKGADGRERKDSFESRD